MDFIVDCSEVSLLELKYLVYLDDKWTIRKPWVHYILGLNRNTHHSNCFVNMDQEELSLFCNLLGTMTMRTAMGSV